MTLFEVATTTSSLVAPALLVVVTTSSLSLITDIASSPVILVARDTSILAVLVMGTSSTVEGPLQGPSFLVG